MSSRQLKDLPDYRLAPNIWLQPTAEDFLATLESSVRSPRSPAAELER